ncbi:MAG: hypothetical protein ACE5H2_02585 [Terriglobia bacterium]
MSQLNRIGPGSMFKLMGFLYLLVGLLIGVIVTLVSFLTPVRPAGAGGAMFGPLAIVILPIFYGLLGAIFGAIGALLYNLAASVTGGLELELE